MILEKIKNKVYLFGLELKDVKPEKFSSYERANNGKNYICSR